MPPGMPAMTPALFSTRSRAMDGAPAARSRTSSEVEMVCLASSNSVQASGPARLPERVADQHSDDHSHHAPPVSLEIVDSLEIFDSQNALSSSS